MINHVQFSEKLPDSMLYFLPDRYIKTTYFNNKHSPTEIMKYVGRINILQFVH